MAKRSDRLKPGTPQWQARQDRWKHNSFQGHVAMAKRNMRTICESQTATQEAKEQASIVWFALDQLEPLIIERAK